MEDPYSADSYQHMHVTEDSPEIIGEISTWKSHRGENSVRCLTQNIS